MPVDIHKALTTFAETISDQKIGLVLYRPQESAGVAQCFANVARQVRGVGGRARYGWMFQYRVVPGVSDQGYLIAIHHAVWNSPGGSLIDVTPFHSDSKHHPLTEKGSVIFLIDFDALPFQFGEQLAPLPSRFFPLDSDERLVAHVKKLVVDEEDKCQKMYDNLADLL